MKSSKGRQPPEQVVLLLQQLAAQQVPVSEKMHNDLLLLSDNNISRLIIIFKNLTDLHLLDQSSFEAALQRVCVSFGRIEEEKVEKKSRKETELPRSEMRLCSTQPPVRFFMEHSKHKLYKKGGSATLKKGYANADSESAPLYSIKHLSNSDASKVPEREVRYHRLLGRQAFWYSRKDKLTVVAEWLRENDLLNVASADLMAETYAKRLQCLSCALTELNIMHTHYSVHGDIKPQNFILDLEQSTLKLIDFGASRKYGLACRADSETYGWTRVFCDPHLLDSSRYSFCDDVYSMGIVTAKLFPELFKLNLDYGTRVEVIVIKGSLTIIEQAIITLVNFMMEANRDIRCTSEDALVFCNELLANIHCLDEQLAERIIDASINRSTMTVEDVLRESRHCKLHI